MKTKRVLITGGNGFLGEHLVSYLLDKVDVGIVIFDKLKQQENYQNSKRVISVNGDICSKDDIVKVFKDFGPFDTVYHLASAMPDKSHNADETWNISVQGTMNMVSAAVKYKSKSFIFTSSNVTYGVPESLPVTEDTPLRPIEIYGKSKAQAERELEKYKGKIYIQIFRCPVITGVGRLGLQAILFEFISEHKNVYVLGDGSNTYQFVDADDVAQALEQASHKKRFDIYTIGGDGATSLRQLYQNVITYAKSTSKIVSLPQGPALLVLSLLNTLNISPLGVYQYSMIGQSMYADTTKIKKNLGWNPKKTITQSFIENYLWYLRHKKDFRKLGSGRLSSNKSLPKMGIFTLLKYIS